MLERRMYLLPQIWPGYQQLACGCIIRLLWRERLVESSQDYTLKAYDHNAMTSQSLLHVAHLSVTYCSCKNAGKRQRKRLVPPERLYT